MKVIQIQQNSEEWLEFRRGKSGGSEFKDLYVTGLPLKTKMIESIEKYTGQPMSPADKRASSAELAGMLEPAELAELKLEQSPKKHYYEIIADRVARPITPNDYVDRLNGEAFSMLARGHILESEAAEAFAKKTGKKLYGDVVWVSDNDDNIYISPDRVVEGDTEAVEIKCLDNAKTIEAYLNRNTLNRTRFRFCFPLFAVLIERYAISTTFKVWIICLNAIILPSTDITNIKGVLSTFNP